MATVVLGVYHPRERTLTYACAGHPPPLLAGSQQVAPVTVCSAPPIGAGLPTGTRQTTVSIPVARSRASTPTGLWRRASRASCSATRGSRASSQSSRRRRSRGAAGPRGRRGGPPSRRHGGCLLRIEGGSQPPVVSVEEIELDRAELQRDRWSAFCWRAGWARSKRRRSRAQRAPRLHAMAASCSSCTCVRARPRSTSSPEPVHTRPVAA